MTAASTDPNAPPKAAEKRAEQLRGEIARHNYLYFVEHAPAVGDREFDALMRELVEAVRSTRRDNWRIRRWR